MFHSDKNVLISQTFQLWLGVTALAGCDVGFSLSDEIDFHSWQEAELITIILSIDKQKHAHSGYLVFGMSGDHT